MLCGGAGWVCVAVKAWNVGVVLWDSVVFVLGQCQYKIVVCQAGPFQS